MNLTAAYNTGSGNQLDWDPSVALDFQYFRVYRSIDPDFVPGPGNEVHTTTATNWTDPGYDGGGVYYRVSAVDYVGNESDPSSPGTTTSVPEARIPTRFALHQNVPNPFNPSTTIAYDLPRSEHVSLVVYDVSGSLVRTLVDATQKASTQTVSWDGHDNTGVRVASGIYFYRLIAGTFSKTNKMVLLK